MTAATIANAAAEAKDVTLLELLDRILDKGVVLSGDITISVADVDLIFLGLRLILTSVERAERLRRGGQTAWDDDRSGGVR